MSQALNIVLDSDSAAAKAGVTIAGNRLVTAEEIAVGGAYAGKDAGTVLITLKVSPGVSIKATGDEKLTWTDSGFSYEENAESVTDGDTIIVVEPTNSPFDDSLIYTLTGVAASVTHKVVIKSDVSGLTFATTTPVVGEDGTNDDTLDMNITAGLPAYATSVDVLYTVEGLKSPVLTGTQTAADQSCTDGALDDAIDVVADAAAADPTATNVTITIKDVKVKTQNARIVGATAAADLEVTTGTAFAVPALTVTMPGGAKTVTAKANITGGVTTDDASGFPVTNKTLSLTGATSAADADEHYTADGTEEVVITVTTTVATMDQSKIIASGLGAGGTVAASKDFAVTNGENEAITLTVTKSSTPTDYFTTGDKVKVEIISGATVKTGVTLESAAVAANAHTATISVAAGDLTGIDGSELVVRVSTYTPD